MLSDRKLFRLLFIPALLVTVLFAGVFTEASPVDDLRIFAAYASDILVRRGYTFIPQINSGIFLSGFTENITLFSDFSTRITVILQTVFTVIIGFAMMGKRMRIWFFTGICSVYLIFSFFVGFFPSSKSFAFLLCTITSVYVMMLYENSMTTGADHICFKHNNKNADTELRGNTERIFYLRARQGFSGIIALSICTSVMFGLIKPERLDTMPEIAFINDEMKIARSYIYSLIGRDGSLAMPELGGGISGGTVSDSPVMFTGEQELTLYSSGKASWYLRGWIGKNYSGGVWNDATTLEGIRFRQSFGADFISDSIFSSFMQFSWSTYSDKDILKTVNTMNFGFVGQKGRIVLKDRSSNLALLPSYLSDESFSSPSEILIQQISDSLFTFTRDNNTNSDAQYSFSALLPIYTNSGFLVNFQNSLIKYKKCADIIKKFGAAETARLIISGSDDPDIATLFSILRLKTSNIQIAEAELTKKLERMSEDSAIQQKYASYVRSQYTSLPRKISSSQRIMELYHKITKNADTDIEKAFAIAQYLRTNYKYTRTPPKSDADGGDYIEGFLFDTKMGYCTHFATAMTLLLRFGGIPSRYVEGFYVSPELAEKSASETAYEYNVRDDSAHAWTEVYIDGAGWLVIEATAGYDRELYSAEYDGLINPRPDEPVETDAPDTYEEAYTEPQTEASITGTDTGIIYVNPGNTNADSWRTVLVIAVILAAAVPLLIVFQSFYRRKIRYGRFRVAGKSGTYAMQSYMLKLFSAFGVEAQKCGSIAALSDCASNAMKGCVKSGELVPVMQILQKGEFSENGNTREEKAAARKFIQKMSGDLYKAMRLSKRLWYRYILCLI
ncbi:hypothetical protein SDC9_89013 [bioreactor metagenome]|uniref:Transglutaminase-like domain-containing protein n=1 Tax=bioreactor metagenome TaxID=1076179 RepID=A0A644ZPN7_9ZZZZ